MKLPNRENAYIPPPKLHDYLRSRTHPDGRSKARWFRALGFDEGNAASLGQALIAIAHQEEVRETRSSEHGVLYVVDGELRGPAGAVGRVRTVWVMEPGDDRPRFVTAYPTETEG